MQQQCARRWVHRRSPRTLLPMKSLLKLALAGALATVLVRWARRWSSEVAGDIPTINPVRDAEPNVAEPLQEGDLRVAQNTPL